MLNGRISRNFANKMKALQRSFPNLSWQMYIHTKELYKEFENETIRQINVVISPFLVKCGLKSSQTDAYAST